jgi:hypothetical protein
MRRRPVRLSLNHIDSMQGLSDDQLLSKVKTLAKGEQQATARLIAGLAEVQRRGLFLGQGYTSLFTYCTDALHLSEHAAYARIEAARVVQQFPVVLEQLANGELTLTVVGLLRPVLTPDNCERLLAEARHKRKHDVEKLVAATRPRVDVPAVVRKLPAPRTPDSAPAAACSVVASEAPPVKPTERQAMTTTPRPAAPPCRPVMAPLAPDRYKIQFTASQNTYDKLQRARALLRHVIPNGDPAAVFDRALDVLLAQLERQKMAATQRSRSLPTRTSHSRHIPAAVRREVWQRDGARCAFVGTAGRCDERGFLELHHVVPFADGGEATAKNIELRCRAHNAYEAELHFGSFLVREETAAYGSVQTEFVGWYEVRAIGACDRPGRDAVLSRGNAS